MRREFHIFFSALMFYTRIPCPKWVNHQNRYEKLSIRYLPLIGWIVGVISFLSYLIGAWLVGEWVGVLLSLISSVLTTGAFHEDGFADTCDGFGGGWTKGKILMIMKDSNLGSYGVIGLIFLFGLKFTLLTELVSTFDWSIIAAIFLSTHALSRLMATSLVFMLSYVRDKNNGKAALVSEQVDSINLWIAVVFGIIPVLVLTLRLHSLFYLLTIPVMFIATALLKHYFKIKIGGYTGDCLGATQQLTELIFMMSILGLWKYT